MLHMWNRRIKSEEEYYMAEEIMKIQLKFMVFLISHILLKCQVIFRVLW